VARVGTRERGLRDMTRVRRDAGCVDAGIERRSGGKGGAAHQRHRVDRGVA